MRHGAANQRIHAVSVLPDYLGRASHVRLGGLHQLTLDCRNDECARQTMIDESTIPIDRRTLAVLRAALDESPIIVELQLGTSNEPERLFFYRYDLLLDYLHRIARPGDRLTAWRFDIACTADRAVVRTSQLTVRAVPKGEETT